MATVRQVASGRATNPETLASTELNSLGNGSGALGPAISNDGGSEGDLYCNLFLTVTFGSAPTADTQVEVYCVPQDGSGNYATENAEGRPREGRVGGFTLDNVTTLQRVPLLRAPVPPNDHKWYFVNRSGVSFPASGSTVVGYYFTESVA